MRVIRCGAGRLVAALIAIGSLTSCGGGGGGGSDEAGDEPEPPPTVAAPPTGNSVPGPRPVAQPREYVLFESDPVRPLALSADGTRLYAVNTPAGRLEILDLSGGAPVIQQSIPVGLEPVAVAEAPDGKVWVVNHVSDSLSIVDVAVFPARVARTLWVGDEPRDIVFAGTGRQRAFVTTAHRGQNSPVDPAFNTAGIGRADVWVFDTTALGASAGGTPETILTLFGDTPRALAASADGSRIYAGIFRSGNQTTVLPPSTITGVAKAPPTRSSDDVEQPVSGLIVKFDGSDWVDERGQAFNQSVRFSLPDFDVFEIDAASATPVELRSFAGVGTILFNIAVNPANGAIYVSNLESRNHVRFAGPSVAGGTSVRGRLTDSRITVIDGTGTRPRHLNKHLDFSRLFGTAAERDASLAMPLDLAVTGNGSTLYATAFGSAKVGIFDTGELTDDTFQPDPASHIELSAGGPAGIALDEARGRAYVWTRFALGISTIDLDARQEIARTEMFNPEPASVQLGRPFLYDARETSSRGNDSCASCHLFGNNDALAWDLGDPNGTVTAIVNTFIPISPAAQPFTFHPMKGPMTTQSMRGLTGHGPMHWRGDRTGAVRAGGETLEEAAFKEFNEAFEVLQAREGRLDTADMQAFTDFAMQLTYPPSPVRNLDGTLTAEQQRGLDLYNAGVVRQQTGVLEVCARCHPIDRVSGVFGTRGLMSDNSQPGERNVKIPHFRDYYQKVGMFGFGFNDSSFKGPQIRGFGYNHNGATTSNFIIADLGAPAADLAALRAFFFAYPTEQPEIVGQQVTLDDGNEASVRSRIDVLVARGQETDPVPACDLTVKGIVAGEARGWAMQRDGAFVPDRAAETAATLDDLLAIARAPDQPLTFTCVPWGSGTRIGIDEDLDGLLDGDE